MQAVPALVLDVAGRLFSIGILAVAILRGGSPLLFLWGLWIDEVLSLVGASLRLTIARRPTVLYGYGIFAAVHLVFVLFFSTIGTTGLFSGASTPLLAWPSVRDLLWMAGALALRTMFDLVRAWWRKRKGREDSAETLAREAQSAVVLPHLTIIAGGFCLVMFRLVHWMAWGILAGRVFFEAVTFFAARREKPAPTVSGPGS